MIEILKKGERKVVYCPACRSQLAYEPEDLKSGRYPNILPGLYFYIDCPVCNERIIVASDTSDKIQVRECLL